MATEFRIPLDLLKTFKSDVRTRPHVLPINGWIIFDREMLVAILRNGSVDERAKLAKDLEELGARGGELAIIEAKTADRV